MPLPATKIVLNAATVGAGGYVLTPQEPGDFDFSVTGYPTSTWVGAIGDLDGDGVAEVVTAAPGNSDQEPGGGRVYITFGSATGAAPTKLGDDLSAFRIDGAAIDDHAGVAIAAVGDQDGNGLADLLVGAALADPGGQDAAGTAYVVWSTGVAGSVDLLDLESEASGEGFAIFGEAAGDHAGHALGAIADLNGDGTAEILVGAPGSDAAGIDAGATYVVWGRDGDDTTVALTDVAGGAGGFRITGEAEGDEAGSALASLADLNGDGKAEILVGAPGSDAGGVDAGAAYVVFGKATGAAVDLAAVAVGTGGFRITGATPGERVGSVLAALGDVNGDGRRDILLGADGIAYVVFGKADRAEVDLAAVAAGAGGFAILPEGAGDLSAIAVAGGGDLNRDGVADIVIGASHNDEGGFNAGAVYVVWGGAKGPVDLSAIALGAGGAKVVGAAGSLTGSSVAVAPDMNGDGAAELIIGSPGASGERVSVLYAPAAWQPDLNVYGTNGDDALGVGAGGLHVIGDGADSIYALDGADSVAAGGGADMLDGGSGPDTLAGGNGNDTYVVDSADDVVAEAGGEGADTVLAAASFTLPDEVEVLKLTTTGRVGSGNALDNLLLGTTGADTLKGAAGIDTLGGDAGNDSLDGGTGADSMAGGTGSDAYFVDDAGDAVVDASGVDTVVAGIDGYVLGADIEVLVLAGGAHAGSGHGGANTLVGGAGADSLFGLGGLDSLVGAGGDDRLDGGSGADSMAGGAGNDLYLVDDIGDRVTELALGGLDTVSSVVDHTLASEVDVLVLAAAGHRGTGNGGANLMIGSAGADTLDGGAGADTLEGGTGDDTYIADGADVIVETAAGGHDVVRSSVGLALGDEVEDLVLTGLGLAGTGNASANAILGSAGADTLDGGGGADTLTGAAGNDLYRVDDAADAVTEAPGGGIDSIAASVDAVLPAEVEALLLEGAARHGTGNALDNLLRGGAGNDLLEGVDGADTLDGMAGADTMDGGAGNDTYLITDGGDVVVELPGGGFDTVVVSTDWVLATGIEGVQLVGTGHSLTGNAEGNTISGNAGDDTLDGAEGDDVELGGDGDDLLICDSGRDTLSGGSGDDRFEIRGGSAHVEDFLGHDTVDASDASGDSSIDLSGEGQSTVGGQICDFGQGGSAAGPLDLQFLQDLTGSFIDDLPMVKSLVPQIVAALQAVQPDSAYGVSSFRDKAYGAFGAPGDWVYRQESGLSKDTASLTAAYTAMVANNGADAPEAQIEALMQLSLHVADAGFRTNSARFVVLFSDAPFHVAGDAPAAWADNDGDGVMDGTPPGTGEDYPAIAQVKAALEVANIIPVFAVTLGNEAAYQGLVTQLGRGAQVTLSADSSNVVAAITTGLTAVTRTSIEDAWGGAGNDTLKGNASGNALEGAAGNDLLAGGAGNDSLSGGLGHDRMEGGSGADSMAGGTGHDTYAVDDTGDVVTESSLGAGGRDTVEASCDWALGTGLEGLVLKGAAVHGVGNLLGNILVAAGAAWLEGLGGNDALTGGLGADTLDGGTGADRLAGAAGNDLYKVDDAGDLVVEAAARAGGLDTVESSVDWSLGTGLEALVLMGPASHGVGNALANSLVTTGGAASLEGRDGNDVLGGGLGADTLDGGTGVDRMAGGAADDVYLVDDARDLVLEDPGAGRDTVLSTVSFTLRTGVEVLRLGGAALVGTGSIDANEIEGNALDNLLLGGVGADTLLGGDGADTLDGGRQGDLLTGGGGADTFRYASLADRADGIADFDPLADTLLVSAAGFAGGLLQGMDITAENRFVVGTAATGAFGQFLWHAPQGRLSWDADGTGAGGPVLLAVLSPWLALSGADLVVGA
ncbi:beta strand repeat-containing protein [Falsiroseomonas oryzae]|uniref:beta strand repeat-containing protein n=1 Tax=Falsiroseomonas oryzae TaxID=2766473 RepID=UPI0022EAFFCA|nr:hypothetical protein [Roseomonas sp. MO-31]